MRNYLYAGAAVAALIAPVAAYAQETTSSMRGVVTSGGSPVAGATVKVTHVPTGTVNTVTSSDSGSFVINGLRVGGPFTVAVVADGYAEYSVTDIFTQIGTPFSLPLELATAGDEIVVTASSLAGAGTVSQGPSTVLTSADIQNVASLNRDIRDLSRRDPFATLDPTNSRAVSFAGQNPRFNRFSVDGVGISDNFGLNPDGLPSRRGPVPLDAIGQYQVKIAPFDISEGNFQGGAINVVLKSGTNEFEGTGFYTYNSDSLNGDSIRGVKIAQPKFKSEDYGIQIAGPIIKDKLFFMVAAERVRANTPLPEGPVDNNAGSPVPNLTQATVNQIQQIAQSRYNYVAGDVLTGNGDKDDRVVAKIDANLSDTQRFSITGTYTKDSLNISQNVNTGTAAPSLGLESNGYKATNRLYTGIAQLNSEWSDSFSTEVRGFYKDYKRGQDPLFGRGFAQFVVCTAPTSDRGTATVAQGNLTTLSTVCPAGTPQVAIGPDISRQSNALDSQTYGFSVAPRLTLNDHDVKLIAEYQRTKIFNQFLQRSAGDYYFDSIADFQAGNAQRLRYQNAVTLNEDDAAAQFSYDSFTFGIQDNWRLTDTFNLSYGIRYDVFGGNSRAALNPNFVNRFGFANNAYINGRGVAQPRIGFDWTPIKRLSIRGGVGIFSGGAPDVYISNSFSNTGILTSSIDIRQNNNGTFSPAQGATITQAQGAAILTNVNGAAIPSTADQVLSNVATVATSATNALDPNFKVPSQYRGTLSTSYDADLGPLGDNWLFGIDLLYSEVKNQVAFTDIRSVPTALRTPDGRVRYASVTTFNDTNTDILLTNTKKGRGFIAVARFDKSWDFGLNIGGSYTRQRIKDQAPATSSTALSNYSNGAFLDANIAAFGTSNDEVRNQFKYYVNFEKAFFGDYKTKFSLFGETRSGRPFSYTFQEAANGRSPVFGTNGGTARYLAYIPTGVNDPLVSYDTLATATTINNFIDSTGLKKFRGKVAPRNGFRSPSFTKIDLHIEQELPGFLRGRSKFSIFADIENLGNLINDKWGRLQQFNFPFTQAFARVSCLQTPVATGTAPGAAAVTSTTQACTQFRYTNPTVPATTLSPSVSLYQIRVGARFTF
jgi:Carboxypeptidase regulatory-like domain